MVREDEAEADGSVIEVRPSPDHALSDGAHSLPFAEFAQLTASVARVAEAVDRRLPVPEALAAL